MTRSPKKNSTWETKPPGENDDQLEIFENSASLKFRLSWTREPAGALVERPRPLMPRGLNQQHNNHFSSHQLNGILEHGKKDKKNKHQISKSQNLNPPRIIYQVRPATHGWIFVWFKTTVILNELLHQIIHQIAYLHAQLLAMFVTICFASKCSN